MTYSRAILAGGLCLCAAVAVCSAVDGKAQLGINLAGCADWNTELPFVDVFRMSRAWISQQKGKGWGQGPELALDEYGWVKRLGKDCFAETPLCTIDGGHYPSGRYTILYDGRGVIDVAHAAKAASKEDGRIVIEVDSSKGGFFLRLMETDPVDYVRNIRVIMPGCEKTYEENPWRAGFLERWSGAACIRFMDFMDTNGSKIARWGERPGPEDATFSRKGVALELMIDLCNRLDSDPWFCIPHLADDDYVRRFASMVKERLDPNLKVYVEYSNEVWNGQFAQSRWAGERGVELGFAEKSWEGAWRYTAYRSVQIFAIWEEVFWGTGRLVRVLPSQAANPYVSEQVVAWQDAYKHADALAIAPYVSFNVRPGGEPSSEEVGTWSVEKVLDYVEQKSLPQSIEWIQKSKEAADKYGLKLMAYEAGQHMVGVGGGENNEQMTRLFHAVNAHPRMEGIYDAYFDAWEKAGGDMLCYFSSVGRWSKWGSWGMLQYYDETAADSPKYLATMRWAKKVGQDVNVR